MSRKVKHLHKTAWFYLEDARRDFQAGNLDATIAKSAIVLSYLTTQRFGSPERYAWVLECARFALANASDPLPSPEKPTRAPVAVLPRSVNTDP